MEEQTNINTPNPEVAATPSSATSNVDIIEGSGDSVDTPEGLVNFHTHPIGCYLNEQTVWGWPSGEDIRETILFAMKGSLSHLVLAIEGVYSLQVQLSTLKKFIHIDPEITQTFYDKIKDTLLFKEIKQNKNR